MDEKGDSIVEKATLTHNYYLYYYIKRSLQLLVPLSLCSFLISYYLQLSTFIFPLFAQALDRKYMFLICNGILAFLAKNLKFSNYGGALEKNAEYGMWQITELPPVLEVAAFRYGVASLEYGPEEEERIEQKQEHEHECDREKEAEEIKMGDFVLENVVLEEEEEDDDFDDDELKESATVEDMGAAEEVNDSRVSTEDLNKRFEEFIRKMKEEIRIEAQQQLIAV